MQIENAEIFEVSLVLVPANPHCIIERVEPVA